MKTLRSMLTWLGLAAIVLASPDEWRVMQPLAENVLAPPFVARAHEPTADARLRRWLTSLAVVRPATGGPGATLFVIVSPVGDAVGVRAIGMF